MSSPLPVCPSGSAVFKGPPRNLERNMLKRYEDCISKSAALFLHPGGKKWVCGEPGPLPLQSAGLPPCTARKTRIRIPGYNNQSEHSKTWVQRARSTIMFSIRSSVVISGHIKYKRAKHLSSNQTCKTKALPRLILPCYTGSESCTRSRIHTLCIQSDNSSSDLVFQKCWVEWKLLCVTLKNRDTGGKLIKHLLNQDQLTRLCEAFFLSHLHENQRQSYIKLENRLHVVLTALSLSFWEYRHI